MERPVFSEMLAERRRELGYSIRQASRVLRLREEVLIAFEEGDFEQMPKSGYAQGMISSYARYLGLDANEVVDAYNEDFKRYRHENRRGGSRRRSTGGQAGGVSQPYVASRGLLPTSGGPAGDMGSFATTRVHTRTGSSLEDDEDDVETMEEQPYPQGRPYTNRPPTPSRRAYRSGAGGRRDIETLGVDGYEDDMRLGRDATPYQSASTRAGRRSSRNISRSDRPRVSRRTSQGGRGRSGSRDRRDGRGERPQGVAGALFGPGSHIGVIAVIAVVIILSLILILSVSSCISHETESVRTVPVSAANEAEKKAEQTAQSDDRQDAATTTTATTPTGDEKDQSTTSGASGAQKETSVSVSVADGAVTWLEVECDGKSDVAQTITGPWQKTYTVEELITIQAGDTTAVSVVQDGRQVQFESMASGIGSIRIQGTKQSTSKDKKKEKGGTEGEDDSSSTGNGSSSGSGASARTGNAGNAPEGATKEGTSEGEAESEAGSEESYGYDESYDYDDSYSYYDYGYEEEYY